MKTFQTTMGGGKYFLTIALIFVTLFSYSQQGPKWSTGGNTISSGDFLGTTNNKSLKIKTNDLLRMKIQNNGTVQVKDSLHVNGTTRIHGELKVCQTILADEVIVTDPTWCDYVFKDNYNLMSISELEEFVVNEQHLPNIPPASSVENEGIKLKEMNQKMMEKIEELTLYIIELHKRIEKLENL